jgi:hypothetical protein
LEITEEIQRFREWYLANKQLLETKPDLFVAKLQLMFNVNYSPRSVRYENSGFDDFKNYSIQDIESKIDLKSNIMHNYHKSCFIE